METAEHDVGAARPVMVGDAVGAVRVGDVDLNDDEVRAIVQVERLYMLVLNRGLDVGVEIGRQRGQSERRKERVLDRPPVRARGLGQRRKDEFGGPHCRQSAYRKLLYNSKYTARWDGFAGAESSEGGPARVESAPGRTPWPDVSS